MSVTAPTIERLTSSDLARLFDLQGPKLRTGPLEPGPAVVHWSPRRGLRGQLVRPVRVRLVPPSSPGPPLLDQDVLLPVDAHWLGQVQPGDGVRLADCRGMDRRLRVVAVDARGVLTESRSTAYVESGAAVHWQPARPPRAPGLDGAVAGRIGDLPTCDQPLVLRQGDILVLTGVGPPGRPAACSADGAVLNVASVSADIHSVANTEPFSVAFVLDEALPDGRTKLTTRSTFESLEDLDGMLQSGMESG